MSKEVNISTYIAPLTRLGTPEMVVDSLIKAGFKSFDFTMMLPILGFDLFFTQEDYFSKAKQFRKYIDDRNICCNQTHGFAPCLKSGDSESEKKKRHEFVKRNIEITSILGAKYCVLHPASDCSLEENVNFFISFKEIAHKNNVVIAIENTLSDELFGKPEDFIELLNKIDDESFKVCLDIGHSEITRVGSSAVDFIKKLKDKIVCLHIHDNDKNYDQHQLPFTLLIQFEPIFKALKECGYKGDITFECGSYFDNMPVSLFEDALKFLHDLGVYISKQIFD